MWWCKTCGKIVHLYLHHKSASWDGLLVSVQSFLSFVISSCEEVNSLSCGSCGSKCSRRCFLRLGLCDEVSMSPVPFPIDSFLKRIEKMTLQIDRQLLSTYSKRPLSPDVVLPFVEKWLFHENNIKIPSFGKSNLGPG